MTDTAPEPRPETPEPDESAPDAPARPETAAEDAPAAEAPPGAPEDGGEPDAAAADSGDSAAEIAGLKNRLLRAVAETENVRKRAARERADAARYAIAGFARDMVGVADDLARALDNAPEPLRESADAKALLEGLALTRRNLDAALERHGLERIDPAGEPFDHNFHEAMFEMDAPDAAPGAVVQVVQAGYRLHDRLLRPARVGVARRRADAGRDGKDAAGNGDPAA